jgi:hypothetical protein
MLKALLRRIRAFMQAEIMTELALLRTEIARQSLHTQQVEAALMTLTLLQEKGKEEG